MRPAVVRSVSVGTPPGGLVGVLASSASEASMTYLCLRVKRVDHVGPGRRRRKVALHPLLVESSEHPAGDDAGRPASIDRR